MAIEDKVGYFKAEELSYLETEVTSSAGTLMQILWLLRMLWLKWLEWLQWLEWLGCLLGLLSSCP